MIRERRFALPSATPLDAFGVQKQSHRFIRKHHPKDVCLFLYLHPVKGAVPAVSVLVSERSAAAALRAAEPRLSAAVAAEAFEPEAAQPQAVWPGSRLARPVVAVEVFFAFAPELSAEEGLT
jgi:hypothetical protein